MSRILVVSLAAVVCACNSAPANTCTPYGHSAASAGASPSTCQNDCVSSSALLGDAAASFLGDASFDVCAVNCTSGGNAMCSAGMTCMSFEPFIAASYCVLPCTSSDAGAGDAGDAGDAGSCPLTTTCSAAGFCL